MYNSWWSDITLEVLYELKDILKYGVSARFTQEFRERYIYNTNAIEGNEISQNDVVFILQTRTFISDYSQEHNIDILGCEKAWDFVQALPPMTLETLLVLHKYVLMAQPEYAGVFRTADVCISVVMHEIMFMKRLTLLSLWNSSV